MFARTLIARAPAALTAIFLAAAAATARPADDPFPPAAPESVGLKASDMATLAGTVRAMIQKDEAVGAELLVIKDHRTVLHEAFGFKDRESKTPMERDTIFCIRSMTKPVVGTAIQMLADEGKLSLSDPVSKHLPAFDTEACRAITIEQLLTHTGGLPLSLMNRPMSEYKSLADVVAQIAEHGPTHPAGTFSYSDCGADTLGAVVAAATGAPVDRFFQDRILGPLGMRDTICVVTPDHPLRPRISSNYMGSTGAWMRYWNPAEPPIFPILLTSQGLYSTPKDYARFMALWLDGGSVNGARLLSDAAVARALKPASEWKECPSGFAPCSVHYGQFWMMHMDPTRPAAERMVVFGHGGSDGTDAWAIPQQHMIVCLFTQARGGLASEALERDLYRLFIAKTGPAPATAAAPDAGALDRLTGLYWSADESMYRAVTRDGDKLLLEIPGRTLLTLKHREGRRWGFDMLPGQSIEFEGDDDRPAPAITGRAGGASERLARITPPADLPSLDEIIALHVKGHNSAGLADLGVFERTGTLDMPDRKLKGTVTSLVGPVGRFRTFIDLGTAKQLAVSNDAHAWTARTGAETIELTPQLAEQQLLDHPGILFGDPRPFFKEIAVIAKSDIGGKPAYILRATPRKAHPTALIIDAQSGLLIGQERIVVIPGLGTLGARIQYEDFRDMDGVKLPFRLVVSYPTPLLGTSTLQFQSFRTHVQPPPGAFEKPETPR